jgi:hypothetical protein
MRVSSCGLGVKAIGLLYKLNDDLSPRNPGGRNAMAYPVFSIVMSILFCVLMVWFWFRQRALERRIAAQKDLPHDRLIPRHYKSFTDVEHKLWAATQEQGRAGVWENMKFTPKQPEFEIVRDYVRGLREDFQRAFNIYGQVIIHSPEVSVFAQLEWQRVKSEFAYCRWLLMAWLRLRTVGISVRDLRELTEIVATIAYRVRSILSSFESSGNVEFVDWILRRS